MRLTLLSEDRFSFLEGRYFSEPFDYIGHDFDDSIYVLIGVVSAQGESDRAVGECVRNSHGPQNMGWFKRTGSAR